MRMKLERKREIAFVTRHIGLSEEEQKLMLDYVGCPDLKTLINQTVPDAIRNPQELDLPQALTEVDFIDQFKSMMSNNKLASNFIGMGYYDCITPKVILRNIMENPGWYTAYTPYQAEIAQGRLEALINYQTMVIDLTGMEVANASLLDEGTAAAEAIAMLYNKRPKSKKQANTLLIDNEIFPQTLSVIKTRAEAIGITIKSCDILKADVTDEDVYAVMVQYPNNSGAVIDHSNIVSAAQEHDVTSIFVADLMSLALLRSPGSIGADVVVGTTQRFGIPLGYGGPHAAYFATKEKYKRVLPGRIIGLSKDAQGNPAYRMALQTREQHIKREKATSNICTAQVLLAVMAGMYGVYHGPDGLKRIAGRITSLTHLLEGQLTKIGYEQTNHAFFDTIKIACENIDDLRVTAEQEGVNLRYFEEEQYVGISIDETTTLEDIELILNIFSKHKDGAVIDRNFLYEDVDVEIKWGENLQRTDKFMTHEVFHSYRSEHEMLRYLKKLENKDLSLAHSMISLGSCTMKLNATTEMIPVTWPEVNSIHPFAPIEQTTGYQQLFEELRSWLAEITGFHGVSLQPNSGAQGEFAGLMVIKAYHESRGDHNRDVMLIPSSAHGTNPASAVMAGQQVVIVRCDDQGNIDIDDLKHKVVEYADNLSGLMVTYPSTHGVFEVQIKEICQIVHDHGGQVYMDGANMNAQVGLTSPGLIGADVCHLNLHKTFCIPHGGGGPGMGPICVAQHLSPFLPTHDVIVCGGELSSDSISAAPFGSASILAISYAYIAMMGGQGLTRATEVAILNANYIKQRLAGSYDILYVGHAGRCAHEMIIDCRDFKPLGIEVTDIAKRLMDYGYHAPTVSFPVPGTMMIEPTESESKEELDRFCDAIITIRQEIREVEQHHYPDDNNVLKNAPHTAAVVMSDAWDYPYNRAKAAYPLDYTRENKFWPSVSRVDNAYGDRNLVCACLPIEAYETAEANG